MRTTLAIDDDVLAAVKGLAQHQHRSIGEVLSDLARQALRPESAPLKVRNGITLLPIQPGALPVTPELIRKIDEETP